MGVGVWGASSWLGRYVLLDHVDNRTGGIVYGEGRDITEDLWLVWLRELDDSVECV